MSDTYQYVSFGQYPQFSNDVYDPILWRVLTVQNGKAYLLSEMVLEVRKFDESSRLWEKSSLKQWLNNEFLSSAFNEQERAAILDDSYRGKVFIPSQDELSRSDYGFSNEFYDRRRAAEPTEYVRSKDVECVDGKLIYFTRSIGSGDYMSGVASTGVFQARKTNNSRTGIRPAIWVKVDSLGLTSGSGSYSDPYYSAQ